MNKLFSYEFGKIYDLYLAKITRKNRQETELLDVLSWLTGFRKEQLTKEELRKQTLEEFFQKVTPHPNIAQIKGIVCGVRVENLTDPLEKQIRQMDKVVDELAKGKTVEKITFQTK